MTRTVTCDDCKKQVKQTSLCICGMWTCAWCTLSPRHDTTRGEHWEMLSRLHPEWNESLPDMMKELK